MNRLGIEERAQIIAALVEGNSIRATCCMTGAAKGTVLRFIQDLVDRLTHRIQLTTGNPDPHAISTCYVERQNLTMRMSMRMFTRLTNRFLEEGGEPGSSSSAVLHVLQLLQSTQHAGHIASDSAGITKKRWTVRDIALMLKDSN